MPSPGEDVQAWSKTALDNAGADPLINWAEGMPRAAVNNSARSTLAAIAKDRDLRNGSIVTTGTPNAQAFISGVGYTATPSGLIARLKIGPGLTNTASTTLNMDGIGAVALKSMTGADLVGGELVAGGYGEFVFDGTNWIVLREANVIPATTPVVVIVPPIPAVNTPAIDFTTGLDGTYDEYVFSGINILPVANGSSLQVRISQDAGVSFKSGASDYSYAVWTVTQLGAAGAGASNVADHIEIWNSQQSATTLGGSFNMHLFTPADNTGRKILTFHGANWHITQGLVSWNGAGSFVANTNPINGIRFVMNTGNIASGKFTVYGVKT